MICQKRKIAVIGIANEVLFHEEKRRWAKKWLQDREKYSDASLLTELQIEEPGDFRNYLRMCPETFAELLKLVGSHLQKQDTIMRSSISPEQRLIATLRFLATGRSYECLKFSTRISAQSLGRIIPETCKVIYEVLREEYLKFPRTTQEWRNIAVKFESRWQFPNCGGALDGKHVRITRPGGTGALYYNYKHFYSIVLLAVVNANYEFIYVDVGKNGRNSDAGVLECTPFFNKMQNDELNLPEGNENAEKLNYVFVGDEAFGLHKNILKPFSQYELTYQRRIFNYRLSRARNVVENAFGIISSRFRVLNTTINMNPINVQYAIMAICTLHNFLIRNSDKYLNSRSMDSEDKNTHEMKKDAEWRNNCVQLVKLQATTGRPHTDCKENRERYLQYFNGKGSVAWQDKMIQQGKS